MIEPEEWPNLGLEEKQELFRTLPRAEAEEIFLNLSSGEQFELVREFTGPMLRSWLRLLHPDDAADLIQQFDREERHRLLDLLDSATRADVIALLTYQEDEAGGLMNPRFVRLRPDTTVDVAIRYLRTQAKKQVEVIHYAYVIDADEKLLGTVSFRDLLLAGQQKQVSEIMETDTLTVPEDMDQEEVTRKFAQSGLSAIPVVSADGYMRGVVTADDAAEVIEEEATEDMHKIGGMEALEAPYLQVSLFEMVKKRAGWLMVLFVGEMFTASVMSYYEHQIQRAIVLALFIPLIISSGGNSGAQATTLMIRAMALDEVKLKDWVKVFWREMAMGAVLGTLLGFIGLIRILFWPNREQVYGEHYVLIALTVSCSLMGIVLWGTLTGSMLPFLLKKLGFDPASASAPFVATLVDVTGIVIYFTLASIILGGTLL